MKITHHLFIFFCCIFLLLSMACKKGENLVINIDKDTIFVNDEVRFTVNVDFKVKDEEWKVLELNESFSNESDATFKFPAKGVYTIEYSAKTSLGRKINTRRKLLIYALPGIIKNYWGGHFFAHGDISLWVKGTRYDGKYYEDSVFYPIKYGLDFYDDCVNAYEPEVFLNVPGGRYKCFLKYKYIDVQTVYIEHSDSVFIDGNCESFNY